VAKADEYAARVALTQRFHGEIWIGDQKFNTVSDAVRAAFKAGEKSAQELIYRVVTGDGAQLENLDMTEQEWRDGTARAGDDGNIDINIPVEDWLELIRIAKLGG